MAGVQEERGEERDTTTHLINFQVFTNASRVTNFGTHNTVQVQSWPLPC